MKTCLLSVAALGALAAPATADLIDITQPGVTLAQVIGNEFDVGDKRFAVPASGFSSASFNPAEIFISPVINDDPATGEGFRLTGAWNDAPGGANSLFAITCDISIRPEMLALGNRVSGAALRFNGFATGAGSVSRVDSSMTVESQSAGLLTVLADGAGSSTLSDIETLNNLSAFRMTTTGSFSAAGDTGTAGASFMDLTFSRVVIPSPAGALVIAAGLALAPRRRR